MRMIILLAALAASACGVYRDPAKDAYPSQFQTETLRDREQDQIRRMQDEFNTLFPDG